MPLYEYECKKCHHRFERLRKFSDPAIKKCPECGGPVEQVISAPAVQFKGSGWYVTDYGKNTSHKPHTSSANGDSKKEGKSDDAGKSEDKKSGEKPKAEDKSKKKAEKK
jgi:putative FmdB family regulatory protein